jgi:hypothetical protein
MWEMIGAALFGSTTGLLGSVVSKVLEIWRYKEEAKARQMSYDHEVRLLEMQMRDRAAERESEEAITNTVADESVRVASYKHDTNNGQTSMWVNDILRLVRPVLTVLMILMTLYVAATFDEVSRRDLAAQIIAITAMCFAWWFGDRGTSKKGT